MFSAKLFWLQLARDWLSEWDVSSTVADQYWKPYWQRNVISYIVYLNDDSKGKMLRIFSTNISVFIQCENEQNIFHPALPHYLLGRSNLRALNTMYCIQRKVNANMTICLINPKIKILVTIFSCLYWMLYNSFIDTTENLAEIKTLFLLPMILLILTTYPLKNSLICQEKADVNHSRDLIYSITVMSTVWNLP